MAEIGRYGEISGKFVPEDGTAAVNLVNKENKAWRNVLIGASGITADVNADGQLHVVMEGKLDLNNSSTTPLGAGEAFTGEATNILEYAGIAILINSDQSSAIDGLDIQFSGDAETWHSGECYSILANATKFFTPPCQSKYYRIIYTNGETPQTYLHLHTVLKKQAIKWSSHRIQDNLNDEDDGQLGLSVIKLRTAQNTYVSGSATTQGNFKVSIEEFDDAVSIVLTDYTDNLDGESVLQIAAAMFGRTDENNVVPIAIDKSTQSTQTIEYEHHEIHSGNHYNYCDYALNQASGAIIEFIITTPNTTEWTHFTFEVSSSAGATLELYEGASGISGGTNITPRNNNRNSANTSSIILIKDPTTITNDGVRAAGFIAGGDRVAGLIGRGKEKILKQNTIYLARITSLAVSNDIGWCSEWYEHIDKG